jgi:hypothetical protein
MGRVAVVWGEPVMSRHSAACVRPDVAAGCKSASSSTVVSKAANVAVPARAMNGSHAANVKPTVAPCMDAAGMETTMETAVTAAVATTPMATAPRGCTVHQRQ